MVLLSDRLKRENNNYDLVRLIAALMVVFAHSFALFNTNGYSDPFTHFGVNDDSGGFAVKLFFFTSGIFIALSFDNSKTYSRFILHRIFRIWPTLLVCVFTTVFVLGIFLTGSFSYLLKHETWEYLICNSTIALKATYRIPGYFTHNKLYVVNGCLWTLPIEIRCYAILLVLGVVGAFKNRHYLLLLAIGAFFLLGSLDKDHVVNKTLRTLPIEYNLMAFFFIGASCYYYRHNLLLDWRVFIFLAALCLAWPPLIYMVLLYGGLTFGGSGIAKRLRLPGDYSYGIYIYGFVVQQIIYFYFPSITALNSMLITFPIIMFIAIISWHYIEKPSLKYVKTFFI